MSTALQLQFFMVQAVNYSVIIVKINCKTRNITNRKRLPWCELINLYNFFSSSMYFTIRHGKRLGETLKLLRLSRVSRTSRSWPASRKLQRLISVSSRTKFWTSRSRFDLGDMGLGSRLGLGSEGFVHIPALGSYIVW